jgi:hypothetical protein
MGKDAKRTLVAAFMTTFGYENELLENIAKAGCHVSYADGSHLDLT